MFEIELYAMKTKQPINLTSNFLDALLQLTLGSSHIFWSGSDLEVINIEVIFNSRSDTLCDAVYFYIELCHWQNTPLRDSSFLLGEIRKCPILNKLKKKQNV